jgi:nucleotide-binding universal stress UspA family protein
MMKPERILLPIDVTKCPLEVFELVNGFAKRPEVTVILLHVLNLNIMAPENRVYEELGREAYSHLDRLAQQYIHPLATTAIRVRAGQPDEEILAEAAEQRADLVILPSWGPSWWGQVVSFWKRQPATALSRRIRKIVRESTCAVFIANAQTRFDCQKAWGRPTPETEDALRYLRTTAAAPADSPHRLAA